MLNADSFFLIFERNKVALNLAYCARMAIGKKANLIDFID
tara:strand:+ start:3443 stop:3562 length:120 start_codon:yes stop_codon:yes gene_type:complete